MHTVSIITSKATSLKNVGKDIAYVLQKGNYVPRLFKYVPNAFELAEQSDYVIFVMSGSPLLARTYMLRAYELTKNYDVPTLYYVTIEGRPQSKFIRNWMVDKILYVANSRYTYDKMMEAGFRLLGYVHHGINLDNVKSAITLSNTIKKKLRRLHPDKVILGVVSNSHKRKGLLPFINVCRELLNRKNNVVVYIITDKPLESPEGVYVEPLFGTMTHTEILAFIGAFDFLVIPSFTEGFGLPLIEANALGVPVIHCNYPPLSEITGEHNFTFPYEEIKLEDVGDGIDYEFHIWKKQEFLSALEDAIECFTSRKSEYEVRKSKAMNHAKKFDINILYPKLLNYLGIKIESREDSIRSKKAEG